MVGSVHLALEKVFVNIFLNEIILFDGVNFSVLNYSKVDLVNQHL